MIGGAHRLLQVLPTSFSLYHVDNRPLAQQWALSWTMSSTLPPLSPPYNNALSTPWQPRHNRQQARHSRHQAQQRQQARQVTIKARHRTTSLDGENEQRRGCHGACHGYLRQDCSITELQYSCDCCIETSLTHTLTRSVLPAVAKEALVRRLLSCLFDSLKLLPCIVDLRQPCLASLILVDVLPCPSRPV